MACLIVHGGAWAIPEHLTQASLDGVERAARAGWKILCDGGTALDAAEEAVKVSCEGDASRLFLFKRAATHVA